MNSKLVICSVAVAATWLVLIAIFGNFGLVDIVLVCFVVSAFAVVAKGVIWIATQIRRKRGQRGQFQTAPPK